MDLKKILKKAFDAGYDTSVMYNCGDGNAYEDFESFYRGEIKQLNLTDVGRSVSVDDIKQGKAHIDMRGSEKWGKKVDRLREILRIAAPKNLHPPAYSFASFYYCKDGYWYESNWCESGSVLILDIVD